MEVRDLGALSTYIMERYHIYNLMLHLNALENKNTREARRGWVEWEVGKWEGEGKIEGLGKQKSPGAEGDRNQG